MLGHSNLIAVESALCTNETSNRIVFAKIANSMRNSLKKSFFSQRFRAHEIPANCPKNNSQSIMFVIVSCQRWWSVLQSCGSRREAMRGRAREAELCVVAPLNL